MRISNEILDQLRSIKNKRVKVLINTILEKGYCTTEDLQNAGYEHAPRAARDARELGIPLVTKRRLGSNGKKIASYEFGDFSDTRNLLSKTAGRTNLTKSLKEELAKRYGKRCNLYLEEMSLSQLQPDHRVPYEIGGDPDNMMDTDYFQLLSPSANRAKSWACEHCSNWKMKDKDMCKHCYWAYPENYDHIAGVPEKKVDIVFKGSDKEVYAKTKCKAKAEGKTIQEYIIDKLKKDN